MTTGTGAAVRSAPTEMERWVCEAGAGGGREAVVEALTRTRLYLLTARPHADAPGFAAPLPSQRDPATGRMRVPVLTPGMLPPWHREWVFRETSLAELADVWPDNGWWLAVNPGTPYEVAVEARPRHRRAWRSARERSGGPPGGRLLTHGGGPLHGPLARALALGAHLAVHNGIVWNQLGAVYQDYGTDVARLRNPWGVHHRAGYARVLEALTENRLSGRAEEYVLRARRTLAERLGRAPVYGEWADAVSRTLAGRGAHGAEAAEAGQALRRIAGHEARLRTEGLLAPDGRIDSLAAFDHGRAVNVVRLALSARYCDPGEAERAVLEIGARARRAYGSWAEFSLGYTLARLILFDTESGTDTGTGTESGSGPGSRSDTGPDSDGESAARHRESLAHHRILTEDPMSPYRNIPW
ncbi:DUF1266 domain-containing protein [Streptomyces sp. NPDC020141]|uniref:DUF1266 domain-containing protein n=1 Tax=Streptomyces sp. NPDC020141 TaxID=3365065 RepID=UPI0037A27F6F